MTRELLVAIHAGSGLAGLIAGLAVFRPPSIRGGRPRLWRIIYGGLLVILVVSLVALIVKDWAGLETGTRFAFSGLAILAGVMLVRLAVGHRLVSTRASGWERGYVSHVYFTYISLWVGLAIVPAVRSANPGLWIPVAVVAVLAAGRTVLNRYKRRIELASTPRSLSMEAATPTSSKEGR